MRFAAVFAALVAQVVAPASAAEWRPDRAVEIIVPTSAGGAADQTGRLIQKLLQSRISTDVTVVNKGGAGGAIAYAYMNQRPGDGHYLSLSTLNLVTNPITGLNALGHADVTTICQLYGEYPMFAVKPDSRFKSGKDLMVQLRQDPGGATISFSPGLGGALHLATATVAKAGGVDPKKLKIVVVQSSAESITAVLGGHVDVAVVTPANLVPHLQAGRLRVIGVTSPSRMEGAFAQVPTWKEQGVPGISASWRGVIGPKGLAADKIRYWEESFAQLVKTDEWKQHVALNARTNEFMGSEQTKRYYEVQYKELHALLVTVGLAR
jgi:putative tricarboxylic transport membrane protein